MNAESTINIQELPVADLEKLVTEYPWFSYAREVLLLKMAEGGREHLEVYLKKCSAFAGPLRRVYCKAAASAQPESFPVIDFEEINRDIDDIKAIAVSDKEVVDNGPKYIVLGGDYFTKEDFAELDDPYSFKVGKLGAVDESQSVGSEGVVIEEREADTDIFYTETLAKIYAEQGYYEEAMKVYSKLILLYPEKSAYFATLVNNVKSKNN